MAKPINIPVRITEDQQVRIKAVAERYDVTDAQVIRWAITSLLNYEELHKGTLHLPIDFERLWIDHELNKELTPRVSQVRKAS